MIVDEDAQLISQTLGMGMDLMTFDKVLNAYVDLIKKQQEE